METAAIGGPRSRVQARATAAYSCAAGQGKRRVVGAGLAATGRRKALVAAVPERLEPRLQEGAVVLAPEADEEVYGDAAFAQISSPSGVTGKTVRVRFVLKEECTFGQSFHLVGDDPALGLWDPSKAVALDWSEGHDWTAERDLAANKLIEFKFLLQDLSGKLHWQNGPNRSVQTGETANTLVVCEDWGDVNNQIIEEEHDLSKIEEHKASVEMEESVLPYVHESRNGVALADETQVHDNQEVIQNKSIVCEDDKKTTVATGAFVQGESMKAHEANQPEPGYHTHMMSSPNQLIVDEPQSQRVLREKIDTEPGSGSAATCADDGYAESTDDDSIFSEDGVPVENGWTDAFGHELLWGWRALQKLLMNLGFKMDTS